MRHHCNHCNHYYVCNHQNDHLSHHALSCARHRHIVTSCHLVHYLKNIIVIIGIVIIVTRP